MLEKIIESEKSQTADNYWGFRKEQVLLQRTELKFRYLFRVIDLGAAVMMVYLGIVFVTMSEETFPFMDLYDGSWLSLLGWIVLAGGIVLYLYLRRLPSPVLDNDTSDNADNSDDNVTATETQSPQATPESEPRITPEN